MQLQLRITFFLQYSNMTKEIMCISFLKNSLTEIFMNKKSLQSSIIILSINAFYCENLIKVSKLIERKNKLKYICFVQLAKSCPKKQNPSTQNPPAQKLFVVTDKLTKYYEQHSIWTKSSVLKTIRFI